ncbi:MAG TPA: hypothetical protein VGG68_00755 [Caulobacteraceae bacterium]
MRVPKITLADRFRDPRNVDPIVDDKVLRGAMIQGERMILDDAAVRLLIQMSHTSPREMRRMLDQIVVPERPMWIEFGSKVMLQERVALGVGLDPKDVANRDPEARTALLVQPGLDDPRELHSWCIEDADEESWEEMGKVMIWPVGLVLYPPDPHARRGASDAQQRIIWGYGKGTDVSPLVGRCSNIVTSSKAGRLGDDGLKLMATELSGWSRVTVAMLAMLQTVVISGEPVRAPGHVREGGRLQPRLASRHATLQVPRRIRNVAAYATRKLREAAEHRKRLHEVRAHYRHLGHEPRAPGWQPVMIGGEQLWRKRIAGHKRGDASLGVVEHDFTVVHGPR